MDPASRKRSHDQASESSSDDDLGPALPNASVRPKKKRKLPYESLYLAALPKSPRYFRSLMHRDQLSFATLTPHTDFLITTSIDGVVKFWKKGKEGEGVDFVKEFRAHAAGVEGGDQSSQGVGVRSIACSADGRSFASSGPGGGTATGHMVGGEGSDGQSAPGSVCIWDVVNFDLITMLRIGRPAAALCWVHGKGASRSLLALAEEGSNIIKIYDGSGNIKEPVFSFNDIHRNPVVAMAYNSIYDCVVSADDKGMVEYWTPNAMHEKPSSVFEYKSSTNLFDFKKTKSVPTAITISPSGAQFATFSLPDRQVRVFDFASAKLYRSYDESIATLTAMQQAGTALAKLDELDFGRRLATEHALAASPAVAARITIIFDESSNFILYGSLLGVKVINTLTNRCVRVYGKDEPFRALSLALYQGQPAKKGVITAQMAASTNPLLEEAETSDPMLVTTAMAKVRFYVFTNDNTAEKSSRDIQNEKPRNIGKAGSSAAIKQVESGTSAVLHTTLGEIHVRLFPDVAPKAVENFVTHARRGYYNGTIFHRVIKKFMIQAGDPLGDGTGGESIWGKNFEDEFSSLKHDKPYTLSMANAGPNTNGSQFFITTVKTPWLDDKHTIFGRAVQGLDVVHRIENARTGRKNEKPEEDIKIVNIEVT